MVSPAHNGICLLNILVQPAGVVYLIHFQDFVKITGEHNSMIFDIRSTDNTTSLRDVLESPAIPKVSFNVKRFARDLGLEYGLDVNGFQDVQIMEQYTRTDNELLSLEECMMRDLWMTPTQKLRWTAVNVLYPSPETRHFSMDEQTKLCYVQALQLLPGLWEIYRAKIVATDQTWSIQTWPYMIDQTRQLFQSATE